MFQVLIVNDHPIVRLGLRSLLESHEGWVVCGEVGDGRQAVQKCKELKPDLVVLDVALPKLNGIDAARQILRSNPNQRILVFTEVDSEETVKAGIEAGIRGWIFMADGASHFLTAVELMERRQPIFSARISDLIIGGYLRGQDTHLDLAQSPKLTFREREVIQLVAEGKTSKQVSGILNIAVKTAETHRSNVMVKLELHSIAGLVMYAVKNGIVHLPPPSVLRPYAPGEGRVNGNVARINAATRPQPSSIAMVS